MRGNMYLVVLNLILVPVVDIRVNTLFVIHETVTTIVKQSAKAPVLFCFFL